MKWKEPVPSLGTSTEAYPVPRGGHTASVVGEKMYIFGGKCPSALGGEPEYPSDVYTLSHLEPTTWHQIKILTSSGIIENLGDDVLGPRLRGEKDTLQWCIETVTSTSSVGMRWSKMTLRNENHG